LPTSTRAYSVTLYRQRYTSEHFFAHTAASPRATNSFAARYFGTLFFSTIVDWLAFEI
jgi:hypothetical protein